MTPVPRATHSYRVEHRASSGTTVLAHDLLYLPPLASRLQAAGEEGELVVVDGATEQTIISWPLLSDSTQRPVLITEARCP